MNRLFVSAIEKNVLYFAFLVLLSPLRAAETSTSFFETSQFACDGCQGPLIVMKETVMRERPSNSAVRVAGPVLKKDSKLEHQEFLTRTLAPGHIEVLGPTQIGGRPVKPGDKVEELVYLSEGFCLTRINGDVVEAECRWLDGFNPETNPDAGKFRRVSKSQTETWVKVQDEKSQRTGWVLMHGLRWSR
jgi:hypothetical protein